MKSKEEIKIHNVKKKKKYKGEEGKLIINCYYRIAHSNGCTVLCDDFIKLECLQLCIGIRFLLVCVDG